MGVFLFSNTEKCKHRHVQRRTKNTERKLNMENENNTTQVTETNVETQANDLEARLAEAEARAAKAEADAARFKKSVDKLTSEAAEKTRQERAKMSEDERAKAEREEEYERLKEKAEADAKELNHLKAVSAYKSISEEKVVEQLIDAISDKDHAAIAKIISDECDKAVKAKEAEWKANRPAGFVGSGSYPSKTKEEILAIADLEEQALEIARHPELFNL